MYHKKAATPTRFAAFFIFTTQMSDEISASTESVTPSDSGVDATAAPASGAGVGEETAISTPADATASAPAAESIDLGWQLDLSEESEPSAVDANVDAEEAELQELSQDPALDPARTPGLVNKIRDLRGEIKTRNGELAQLRQQNQQFQTQLEQYGGIEGVAASMGLLTNLISDPANGATAFMNEIGQHAVPVYWAIADDLVANSADYLVQKLQEQGKLPAFTGEPVAPAGLDADTLASIPEPLRAIAQRLAVEQPKVLEDLLLQPDEVRNYNLEREAKLQTLTETQAQQAREQWESRVQSAQQQGFDEAKAYGDQLEKRIYDELGKWTPYGEDRAANTRVHKEIVEGAMAELLGDQKFAQMYRDADAMIRQAPLLRLHGQGFKADDDQRKGRQMAAQLSVKLGQIITARVKERASIYSDALKWREHQRQSVPNRTEIPGNNAAAAIGSSGKGVPALKNGRIAPEFLEELAASVRS